jgi:hypothetical protein
MGAGNNEVSRLEIIVTGDTSQGEAALSRTNQKVNETTTNVTRMGKAGTAAVNDMAAGVRELAPAWAGFASSFVTGGIVAGIGMIGKEIWNLGVAGAQLERTKSGFAMMAREAGVAGDEVVAAMSRASRATIMDDDLMLMANQAWAAGLKLSADQLGGLVAVSKARAKALGTSTQETYGEAIQGIIMGMPRSLKKFGVEDFAETSKGMNDAERQVAAFNAIMTANKGILEASGSAALSNADKIAQMKVQVTEAKESVELFMAPFVGGVAETVTRGIEGWTKAAQAWKEIGTDAFQEKQASLSFNTDELSTTADLMAGVKESIAQFNGEIEAGRDPTGALAAQVEVLEGNLVELEQRALRAKMALFTLGQAPAQLGQGKTVVDSLATSLHIAGNEAKWLADNAKEAAGWLMHAEFSARLGFGSAAANKDTELLKYQGAQTATNRGNALLNARDYEQALKDSEAATKQLTSAMNSAASEFESSIRGIMTPTSVTEMDILGDKLGKRQGAWDEPRRRYQDIVNQGTKSPWAAHYGIGGSDDEAKYAAMQRMQQFDNFDFSSLPPEEQAVMKERIKQQYQEQVAGQRRQKAFISGLGAEMGWSAEETAQMAGDQTGVAKAAVGGALAEMGGGGKDIAVKLVQDLKAALAEEKPGVALIDQIDKDRQANGKMLKAVGKEVWTPLLLAISDTDVNVLNLLADKIEPGVAARLEAKGYRKYGSGASGGGAPKD